MQIDMNEARIVLAAIHIADFETGENCCEGCDSDSKKLEARIRAEFPELDKAIRDNERKEHIWSVLSEKDPRVIKARKELESMDYQDPRYDDEQRTFFLIKGKVNRELRAKEGL